MNRAERVIVYLELRPNQWISALVFMEFAGYLSSRTAISEARLILEASGRGTIENHTEGRGKQRRSFYRFVPRVAVTTVPAADGWSLTSG